ncbi:UDP-3-O-acylglucosamine N-acyltransferase [Trichinella pseudospiralis]
MTAKSSLFILALISPRTVRSVCSSASVLLHPNTFVTASLAEQIFQSKKPPQQGAQSVMIFHSVQYFHRVSGTASHLWLWSRDRNLTS